MQNLSSEMWFGMLQQLVIPYLSEDLLLVLLAVLLLYENQIFIQLDCLQFRRMECS